MLFLHTWQNVVNGTKTLTSRRAYQSADGSYIPCTYKAGKTYAVQNKWLGKAIAHITIESVAFCDRVRDICDHEGRAEGFADAADFIANYEKHFGAKSLDRPCWRIRFKLASEQVEKPEPVAGRKGRCSKTPEREGGEND